MISRKPLATLALNLTLIAALGAAAMPGALAAESDSVAALDRNATPVTELVELDEIMVRGQNVRNAIADAEDEFFSLYNRLNKDNDYSTTCVYINMDPDTRIRSRICIPGFMADALADQVYFAQQCQSPGNDENGNPFPPPPCYTPPPPQLVLLERSRDYANHMLKVIQSDDRLGKMAGNLDKLYYELLGVQQQYLKVKNIEEEARKK